MTLYKIKDIVTSMLLDFVGFRWFFERTEHKSIDLQQCLSLMKKLYVSP